MKRILTLLLLLVQFQIIFACFCITPKDSAERADVIFKGIAHIDTEGRNDACYYSLYGMVEFEVVEVMKKPEYMGACNLLAVVQSATTCAFSFEQDSAYIVYATLEQDALFESNFPFVSTYQCSGTHKVSLRDLKQENIDNRESTSPMQEENKKQPKSQFRWLWLSLALNGLLGLMLLWRIKRG